MIFPSTLDSMPTLPTLPTLPPMPSLSQGNFNSDIVQQGVATRLEALLPASDLYLCRDANAPNLLFVPGLGMDGLGFVRQMPLGALAHLRFFQTPNDSVTGESGLGHAAAHVERYIVERKLDQQVGGLILAGSSMGGAIALKIAIRARVKVRALVLIGTFGSHRHISRWQRMAAPLAWVVPFAWMRKMAWRKQGRSSGSDAVTPDEAEWMIGCRVKRTFRYFGRSVGALTRWHCLDDAAKLRQPALIVHGAMDNVLPFAAAEELQRTLPNAQLVRINGARHTPFFTHAAEVNEAIARFLCDIKR